MRKVIYVFEDGTEMTSWAKACEYGKSYKVELREVETEKPKLSPIRQAMLDQFGYVSASLKDKVVLD